MFKLRPQAKPFARALPDSPFVDAQPVRSEVRKYAARLLTLDARLETPRSRDEVIEFLRSADVPFALDELLRDEIARIQ